MKKILFLCLIALGFMLASCSKEENAKDFAGKYTCYVESGYYENNDLVNLDSNLVIKNTSNGTVTDGCFKTTGTIVNGKLYFKQIKNEWYEYHGHYNWYDTAFIVTDSIYRCTTIDFGEATLDGNVLRFNFITSSNDNYHGNITNLVCYKN